MPIIHKIPQPHHLVKLKGDLFCGFYKSSLIGDADFECLEQTAEFAGDWAWRLKRIVQSVMFNGVRKPFLPNMDQRQTYDYVMSQQRPGESSDETYDRLYNEIHSEAVSA